MRYRFDEFELDARRYELRRDGAVCHVEPLVFDLILFFGRNAGRVIGREELVDQVWRGRAVSEATISSCVKAARRALGDSGDSQSYIRTIRGRGFEFAGRITTIEDQADRAALAHAAPPRGALDGHGSSATAATRPDARPAENRAERLSSHPVLAVLPFANLSAEVDEYFADGLTEDIIMNLSRFRDLRVIAGASTLGACNVVVG